jgi:hypothetical protein
MSRTTEFHSVKDSSVCALTGYASLSSLALARCLALRRCQCMPSGQICRITSYLPPRLQYPIMSATPATTAASSKSRFLAIFLAALKLYQKQTKKDLLTHPLASQLQSCESTTATLRVHEQVREFEKNRDGDERWMKWLALRQRP